ncbi:hypothetical protein G7011_00495 [Pseudomonas plecoglossicida]|uniref:hypothetical protein n=1 Tax=Pseudomonas plecoglossicida TaxID=70775 RepID=UPI0015E46471|nr:hypothetical protein [Pseudomonas plecoglossicida]MBA1195592.1 hypothetical protein [Pseudomonas plecoglossicida]
MTREQRKQATMRTRQWFAAVVQNAEPLVSMHFDDLTDEQQDLVHIEQQRIAKRIERTVQP